ncbi:interleukin-11 receptor subunit alpha [Megalops cyprinoides]|uniref:interleukin-11 receptor subunit alpha n=1 Tax=Megalops cyprinoides TaxID=118141 RepID=UPI001863FDFE|nr:interleukin-11 receptor subunit alpha [Megalops cyprinoides]
MPGFASCPGSLIVVAIIIQCTSHINSEIWSNEVSNVQYGKLGSNVTLVCKVSGSGSAVEWRLNGSAVSLQQAPSPDGSLTLINADRTMEGNYSCHDERGNVLRATKLRLGYMPGLLSVSCKMSNHHSIKCSWEQSVKTYLPTKYIASYRDRTNKVKPCHQASFHLNECTIRHPTMWHHYHIVNITEVNPLGSETTLVRVQLHSLLKPDPPEAVTPEPVVGHPRRLRVSWSYPSSWPNEEGFPLNFQLRYRPQGSINWSLLKTTNTILLITDLLVAHPHIIQVQARDDLNYGQWSDWSPEVQALPWTEPKKNDSEESNSVEPFPAFPDYTEPVCSSPAVGEGADHHLAQAYSTVDTDYRSLGVSISLGLFAGIIMSAFIILLWVRQRRRDEVTKQELTSMVKMK